MAAKRADQVIQDKKAEEAHKQWEAEKNQQIRTAHQHDLHHQQSLAQQRLKQEQRKVGCHSLMIFPPLILC